MRYSRRKPEMESFSTFGGTRASTARLSQARLDIRNETNGGTGDVISLAHHPGREFLTIPRKYPMPVPPPLVVLPRDHLDVVMMNDVSRSGCQSTTSSSGYSTLGVRTPAPGLTKNRSHSVNSESESLGGGSAGGCGGLLQTSGCESGSSTDNLSSKGDRDEDHQSSRIVSRPVSEHLGSFNLPSNTNSIISAAVTATNSTPGGNGGGGGGGNGVIMSISTPV